MQGFHLITLAAAGVGQALLLAFAWGFLGAVLLRESLTLPYPVAHLMYFYPTETTLVVTLVGTVFSLATTSCFSIAFKEALRYRIHKPISFMQLAGGVTLARGEFCISFRHILMTLVTIGMFALTKLMVSSWSTLMTPTLVAVKINATGSELNLNSSYFESQLQQQILSTGGALPAQGNSIKIIDIDGLLSGIATAQYSLGVRGLLNFNGVLYNVSTGGVLPAAPGYTGSDQQVQPNNTGLNFVGGSIPTNLQPTKPESQTLLSNFTVLQQGLTADVTCFQVPTSDPQAGNLTITQSSIPVSVFSGDSTWLLAYAYNLTCNEGIPAQQDYVVRVNNEGQATSTIGVVASLVCPYPVGQSQLDWTQFNVTSLGSQKYSFLQLTTCEITPKLTTSLVTYAYGTLNATVINSTSLTSSNANLALFLASLIDYQSTNAQSLVSNSIGDALYSIAVATNTGTRNSGSMDPHLIQELEQYWRGVIEFSGTYLRSGFSAASNPIPDEGLVSVNATQIITTMGWTKRSPTYLYTVLPVTFFALLTYAAIGYALWQMFAGRASGRKFAPFDPTDPIHLVMVSSTRVPGEKEAGNLTGETLGGFNWLGIQKNEDLQVELDDVYSGDGQIRKRFKLLTSTTPDDIGMVPKPMITKDDVEDLE